MGSTKNVSAPTPEQEADNALAFAEAERTCPDGYQVCGTIAEDGRPVYFHAPADVTEDSMRELAFSHRHGRPMSEYEKSVLAEAKRERDLA